MTVYLFMQFQGLSFCRSNDLLLCILVINSITSLNSRASIQNILGFIYLFIYLPFFPIVLPYLAPLVSVCLCLCYIFSPHKLAMVQYTKKCILCFKTSCQHITNSSPQLLMLCELVLY